MFWCAAPPHVIPLLFLLLLLPQQSCTPPLPRSPVYLPVLRRSAAKNGFSARSVSPLPTTSELSTRRDSATETRQQGSPLEQKRIEYLCALSIAAAATSSSTNLSRSRLTLRASRRNREPFYEEAAKRDSARSSREEFPRGVPAGSFSRKIPQGRREPCSSSSQTI